MIRKHELRNKHITRFGSPLTHSGARYIVSDQEGLIQMDIDMGLAQHYAKGIPITPDIESKVKSDVQRKRTEYHEKVNQLGVPDKLRDLFLLTKKVQAEQYCRDIVLSEYDLFLLIHNCSQINFTHRFKYKPYIPENLKVLDTDIAQMKAGSPKKLLKKIRAGLLERRYIHVHLFEYSSQWHCFYFSHQELDPDSWKYGSHLHYISHLWADLKKRWVWNSFNKRSTKLPGLHIRFEPWTYPDLDEAKAICLSNGSNTPPWAVAFDPKFACGCGSVALPVSHMATRGMWITDVTPPSEAIK